jgi:hypothetical protein
MAAAVSVLVEQLHLNLMMVQLIQLFMHHLLKLKFSPLIQKTQKVK